MHVQQSIKFLVPSRTSRKRLHLQNATKRFFRQKDSDRGGRLSGRVAMETNDKLDKVCQTFTLLRSKLELARDRQVSDDAMIYDETVEVNAQEIETPEGSDGDEEVVKAAMSKFNPPVRHTARHDFDDSGSGSESEMDNFLDNPSTLEASPRASTDDVSVDKKSPQKPFELSAQPIELPKQSSKDSTDRQISMETLDTGRATGRAKSARKRAERPEVETSNSETESDDLDPGPGRPDPAVGSGRKRTVGVVIPAEGAYDPKNFQDLKLPSDIENLFQYIMKYTPQKIDIDFKLQPFVPEYVPAVGDIDAFIKVTTPVCNVRAQPVGENVMEHIDNLGLTVLDEPATEQSDSALLHLQLRAISKTNSAKSTVLTKKIENAEKNSKAIDRWIKDVSELHLSKPAPTVSYSSKMPDIDTLMEEWPENMEETLNDVGFPPPALDCSLSQYVDIVCGLFDIPIAGDTLNDRIQALHLLFSLFSAVKNNQLFEERQEKVEV